MLPKLDHEDELGALIERQSDPASPDFHRFLTGIQFQAYFGPSATTVGAAKRALKGIGFHIDRVSWSGNLVVATAPASVVASQFGIPLYSAARSDGTVGITNLDPYSMPKTLQATVASVTGLDSISHAHNHSQMGAVAGATGSATGTQIFSGATPLQLESANDMPVLHGYPGTYNQVLATLVDGYPNTNDLATFLTHYGISDSFPLHQIRTGNGNIGGDRLEATLDAETIASTAPGAYLVIYTMPDLSQNSVIEGINSFVNDNARGNSATLSMSFGECDSDSSSFDSSIYQLTQSGTAKGQTFVASSGDDGVDRCSSGTGYKKGPAETPASDPLVIAVGGTSPDTQYTTVWAGGPQGQFGWAGSGGGTSAYYGKPPFQNSLGCGKRCSPDIALPADPYAGLLMYCPSGCGISGFFEVGGTSLASPLAAAALAEISQMRGSANGFATNAIYASFGGGYSSGKIVDITAGNNGAQAGSGWDFATGVGTMDWYLFEQQPEI